MIYNPDSFESRRLLADKLVSALTEAGFIKHPTLCYQEDTYTRDVFGGIKIYVYTSIVKGSVRSLGKDAIRIVLVYHDKEDKTHGLGSESRVNRTGSIDDIVDRVGKRVFDVKQSASSLSFCKCGAPKFRSSKGNMVCTEFCWTK